jgi:hypothetical protein
MEIIIGLVCLILIWFKLGYDMLNAPFINDNKNIKNK